MEMGLLMLLMKKNAIIQLIALKGKPKRTTFGEPLLHAEVVLLNRTSIVDLAVAVGQWSCHSALTNTLLISKTITLDLI